MKNHDDMLDKIEIWLIPAIILIPFAALVAFSIWHDTHDTRKCPPGLVRVYARDAGYICVSRPQ